MTAPVISAPVAVVQTVGVINYTTGELEQLPVFSRDFLEHAAVTGSQYDGTCRRMAAQLLKAQDNLQSTQDMLTELHGYVRDMCVHLGADEDEVPCDAWTLRDLLIVVKRVQLSPRAPVHNRQGNDDYSAHCNVCGGETDEGHTHQQCYEVGKSDGYFEGHLDATQKLAAALGIEFGGETLYELLAKIPVAP